MIDLGTSYAGQAVRIRFRYATANGHSGALPPLGWQIDAVDVGGIDNLPFTRLVADNGLCGNALSSTTLQANGPFLHVVVGSSLATPTGTVELIEGGRVVAAAPLANGAADFDPSLFLAPGTHNVMASFAGTTNFQSSNSPFVTITVALPARRRAVC